LSAVLLCDKVKNGRNSPFFFLLAAGILDDDSEVNYSLNYLEVKILGGYKLFMKGEIVSVKGNKEGLQIICNEKSLWSDIIAEIKKRLTGENAHFFTGASAVVDIGDRFLSTEEVSALWEAFKECGLKVKSIKTNTKKELSSKKLSSTFQKGEIQRKFSLKGRDLSAPEYITQKPLFIIKKNVRSGQNITFDGNVLIFGDVNPGAEIIASGFIMVMGYLRGIAHAGALGDAKAWVMSLRLQPTQLRIANCITRAPDEEPQEPEVASIHDGVIVCETIENFGKYYEFNGGI
jgi:septum site-determining protein MinC